MSDQDAFDRILAALYDAMLDDGLWPATSALIDEACGRQGNGLLVGEGPKDDIRVLFVGLYYRGQRRADWEREYLDIYHPIDECVPRLRQLPDSHLVHLTALYTAQELKTSPTYNEAMARANGQDGLIVRLDVQDGSYAVLSIKDPVTPDGWTTPQLALIKGLLPHIRQFVRVRQTLAKAEARGAAFATLRANPRIGVLYLDRRGQLVEANDRARDLLRRSDGVTDRGGLVQASVPTERGQFAELIAHALPAAGTPVSSSMLLHRGAVSPPFVVHVTPVGVPQLDFGARRVAVLVLLVEPGYQPGLDPALVARTLGLSPAESHIAVWLAEGRSVRDIAETTGRQENSIYWYVKRIYHKLAISRQTDLVRLVLSLAAFR
jgi:DNA-binding CsgD family transcriptional regulator/PAS domain-containing protein